MSAELVGEHKSDSFQRSLHIVLAFLVHQNWELLAVLRLVKSDKVLGGNLTNNTKIVHFTQNIYLLRREVRN